MKLYLVPATDPTGQSAYMNLRLPKDLCDAIDKIAAQMDWPPKDTARCILATATPAVMRHLANGRYQAEASQYHALLHTIDEAEREQIYEKAFKKAKAQVAWNESHGYKRTAAWIAVITLRAVRQMPNREMREALYKDLINQWRNLLLEETSKVRCIGRDPTP